MNFAFSEEQEELRKSVRRFLESKSPETAVRELMETTEGYDPKVWSQMGQELGLQGLAIPEEYGGSGYSYVELIIVLEEMGRALLAAPYFSTILAANALLTSGDDAAKKELLPGIAAGDTIATLAITEDNGRWDLDAVSLTAKKSGDGYTLDGHKMFVIDGHTAGLIVVAAKSDAGLSLFAVEGVAVTGLLGGEAHGVEVPAAVVLGDREGGDGLAARDAGQQLLLGGVVTALQDRVGRERHGREVRGGEQRTAHLFEDDDQLDVAVARPAVLLGNGEALQTELLAHLVPDLGVVALGGLHEPPDLGLGALLLEEPPNALPELFLLLIECEVHGRDPKWRSNPPHIALCTRVLQ